MWKHFYTEHFLILVILEMFPHFQNMAKIEVSIIVSIPHCPVDYFIPYYCLDDIFNSPHSVSRTVWNANDDSYSNFGLLYFFIKKNL